MPYELCTRERSPSCFHIPVVDDDDVVIVVVAIAVVVVVVVVVVSVVVMSIRRLPFEAAKCILRLLIRPTTLSFRSVFRVG